MDSLPANDGMSIITDTTHDSRASSPQTPVLCFDLKGLRDQSQHKTPQTSKTTLNINECGDSPVVPVLPNTMLQQRKMVHTASSTPAIDSQHSEDSATNSELSEPLIPLIYSSTAHTSKVVSKRQPEQESQVEESQSLLPQEDTGRSRLKKHTPKRHYPQSDNASDIVSPKNSGSSKANEAVGRKIDNLTSSGFVTHHTSLLTDTQETRQSKSSSKKSSNSSTAKPNFKELNTLNKSFLENSEDSLKLSETGSDAGDRVPDSQASTEMPAKEYGIILDMQNNMAMSQSQWDITQSQLDVTQSQGDVTQSQVDVTSSQRDITQSQVDVTLSEREITPSPDHKDSVTNINTRLEKLISALGEVPKNKMMVMESAIIQCVTRLQDRLNHRLTTYSKHNKCLDSTVLDGTRKMLQCTQTNLSRLMVHHKTQRDQLSQITPQSQAGCSQQEALVYRKSMWNVGIRQKEVCDLVKRQKQLVHTYKALLRPSNNKTSASSSKPSQVKLQSNSNHTSTHLNKNKPIQYTDPTERKNNNQTSISITNATVINNKSEAELDEDCNKIRKTNKQLTESIRMKQLWEQIPYNPTKEETEMAKSQFQNKAEKENTSLETDIQDTVQDIEPSQDVTTIPDTQEQNTQELTTPRQCINDIYKVNKPEKGKEIKKNNANTTDEISTKTFYKTTTYKDHERESKYGTVRINKDKTTFETKPSKRNYKGSPENKTSKIPKKDNFKKTAENVTDDQPKAHSEMLWLNMLRKSDNAESDKNKNAKPSTPPVDIRKKLNHYPESTAAQCDSDPIEEDDDNIENDDDGSENLKILSATKLATSLGVYKMLSQVKDTSVSSKTKLGQNDDKFKPPFKDIKDETNKTKNKNAMPCPTKTTSLSVCSLMSPPQVTIPGETWDNVSPTATSMSSDVFMVKAKELEKRMKRRVAAAELSELSQSQHGVRSLQYGYYGNTMSQRASFSEVTKQRQDNDKGILKINHVAETPTITGKVSTDTISEAIDSVIEKARQSADNEEIISSEISKKTMGSFPVNKSEFTASKISYSKQGDDNTNKGPLQFNNKPTIVSQMKNNFLEPQPVLENTALSSSNIGKRKIVIISAKPPSTSAGCIENKSASLLPATKHSSITPAGSAVQSQQVMNYPSLKALVMDGKLKPGTNVLTVKTKDKLCTSSLTPEGKILTPDGTVFTTPTQWLSSLTHWSVVKKTRAYRQVMYKGTPLASFSSPDHHNDRTLENSRKYPVKETVDLTNTTTVMCDIVDKNVSPTNPMSTDEKYINDLLSTSVVRLLSKKDLVSCDDLPDNFWTEDFTKVKLPSDVWATVDQW